MTLKLESREYKVMLDHQMFAGCKEAVKAFWEELTDFADANGVKCKGDFESTKKREIVFLDTEDHTIRLNKLVLRQRVKNADKVEYTLKCRSPDRYVASAADLKSGNGFEDDPKFEEDITAPFHSRFSHSNTVIGTSKAPENIGEAASIFPLLAKIVRDGTMCAKETELAPVNAVRAHERVSKDAKIEIAGEKATAALIFWSNKRDGRPLVAEFSFRFKSESEEFCPDVARKAMEFFTAIQRLDWFRPDGLTKTQYAYRTTR